MNNHNNQEHRSPKTNNTTEEPEKSMQVSSKRKEKTRPLFSDEPSSTEAQNADPPSQPKLDTPQLGNSSASDLDILIALCKGTRLCVTRHPIQDLISDHLISMPPSL